MQIPVKSMYARAVPLTSASSMLAAADPSTMVQIEMAGGGVMTISLAQALAQGLVSHAANGSWAIIPGKTTRLRMITANSAAAFIRPGQPTSPPASAGVSGAAAGAATATTTSYGQNGAGQHSILAMEAGAESDKPKAPSEMIGDIASMAFLARGLLSIAKGPGLPSWQTVYFAAHGLNHYTNKKLLPEWLAKGPVKDGMEYAIIGDMLLGSFRALPKANAGLLDAAHAAGAASGIGAKALAFAKGAIKQFPAEAEAPVAKVTAREAANLPFLSKLFPMMKPLYYIAVTTSSVSSIVGATEYMSEHGTKGMVHTQSGRDAWIGALSGMSMLGSLYMPPSPLQLYVDFASSALWMLQALNGHGIFDGLLGGDPKESTAVKPAEVAAAKPADAAVVTPSAPASSAAMPAAAAVANTAVAGMTPSAVVPTIVIPTSHSSHRRKPLRART